jgi:Zn-dependent peptidase ImmA (M78 family)/transcriptional regulator with XRE-family HTH domain
MSTSIPSLAEPDMLKWFRKCAGYTAAEASKKLGRKEEEVVAWENGEGSPSFAQLRKLADIYKRPVAAFYLTERPRDFSVMHDFRRLPASQDAAFTPELRFLIRNTYQRQSWAMELLKSSGMEALSYVGSVSISESSASVGAKLRAILGVTIDSQKQTQNKDAAFRFWRERCEAIGMLTFLARGIDVAEMRGFAIPNPYAPIVAVNSKDSYAGRTFTLLHEMAHILLGKDGVSDRNVTPNPRTEDQHIEVFCNAVAAEALVPSADFRARMQYFGSDLSAAIERLSSFYRVSEEVIARRLLDLGFASRDFYELKRQELNNRVVPPREDEEIRIQRHVLVLSNIGRRFGGMAVSAFHDGQLSGSELSSFLEMKLSHLPKLEAELFPAHVQTREEIA